MTIPAEELLKQAWQLERERRWDEVEALLAPLPREAVVDEPELGLLLAVAIGLRGELLDAVELVEAIAEPCRRRGDDRLSRRRWLFEASLRVHHGELERAEAAARAALESATEHGDELHVAGGWQNLGVVADIRCRWDEAIANYQRAMAAAQRIGHHRYIAITHHCLAMAYRQLGMFAESHTHFEYARDLFQLHSVPNHVASTDDERALLLCYMGDTRLAEATAQRALRWFTERGHRHGRGEALRVLAIIHAAEGEWERVRPLLEESLELARETRNRLLQAEVWEELAVLAQVEGDEAASREAAERARAAYEAIGAGARAERMEERLRARAA